MQDIESSKYRMIIVTGLTLFSLSLALSKSATNIFMALLYVFVLFLMTRYREFRGLVVRTARQPLLLPLAIYLSIALLGLFFTSSLSDGIGIANKIAGLLLVYVLVSVLLDANEKPETRHQNAEQLLLAFVAGIFALDVIGVLTYLGVVGHRKFFLPLSALNVYHIWFANLNAIGMYTAAAFLIFSARGKDLRIRAFLFSFLPLGIFSILFSLSRTAWLGMFATGIVLAVFYIKKKKILFITLFVILGSVVLLYLFSGIVHERLNLIASDISLFSAGLARTNIGERFLMWKAAFRMFLTNPIFGVGTGDYVATMNRYMSSGELPEYLSQFNQPHNMYLFALATNGLLGLSALLFVFYGCLRFALPLLRSTGREKLFAFLATATAIHFMTAGLTDSFFNIQILRYTFAFVMGVCVRTSVNSNPASSPTPRRF